MANLPTIQNLCLFYDTSRVPLPGEIVPCLMCAKPMLMPRYIGNPDQVCPECWSTYDDCARVVCARCKVVVARVKPGPTDSGYHVRKREVLHIDKCNVCANGTEQSVILELEQQAKASGKATKLWLPVGVQVKGNK